MSWVAICDVSQVQEEFPYSARVNDTEIGVFLVDDQYYAMEDVCPHAYALLSQGVVEDGKVECPLHEAVFDIKTGKCLREPGGRDLKTYQTRINNNQIEISFIEE
ncbi:nitrite reductase small subunit NirD [Providencia stuartii]|uniref:nitrite reductase small subunit NirD n=1 Tax=Providencia stuartii TaxID=588 RepID=UPI002FD8ED2F